MAAEGSSSRRRRGKQPMESSAPLLYCQNTHKSGIAQTDTVNNPNMRECLIRSYCMWEIDPLTSSYVEAAGFKLAGKTSAIHLNPALLHALAERWRPETHTFHLPQGEMTITLQDVSMILGLRADGWPVTDFYRRNIVVQENTEIVETVKESISRATVEAFEDCFESIPEEDDKRGKRMDCKVTYLYNWKVQRGEVGFDTRSNTVALRRARAYIMVLLGECLLASSSQGHVPMEYAHFLRNLDECSQYSWASAVLSFTYRGLCKWTSKKNQRELPICGVLLQVWCWTRIAVGRPKLVNPPDTYETVGLYWAGAKTTKANVVARSRFYYRDQLLLIKKKGICWEPYSDDVVACVAPICSQAWGLSKILLPLIHFNIVEWQRADRVYRQFSLPQPIPADFPIRRREWDTLHTIEKWSKTASVTWETRHKKYIDQWNDRWVDYADPAPIGASHMAYMSWYESVTKQFVYYDDFPPSEAPPVQTQEPLSTQGYFDSYGQSQQIMVRQLGRALIQARKALHETQDMYVTQCLKAQIVSFRETFEAAGALTYYDLLMSRDMNQDSDEDEPHTAQPPAAVYTTQPPLGTQDTFNVWDSSQPHVSFESVWPHTDDQGQWYNAGGQGQWTNPSDQGQGSNAGGQGQWTNMGGQGQGSNTGGQDQGPNMGS